MEKLISTDLWKEPVDSAASSSELKFAIRADHEQTDTALRTRTFCIEEIYGMDKRSHTQCLFLFENKVLLKFGSFEQ